MKNSYADYYINDDKNLEMVSTNKNSGRFENSIKTDTSTVPLRLKKKKRLPLSKYPARIYYLLAKYSPEAVSIANFYT